MQRYNFPMDSQVSGNNKIPPIIKTISRSEKIFKVFTRVPKLNFRKDELLI